MKNHIHTNHTNKKRKKAFRYTTLFNLREKSTGNKAHDKLLRISQSYGQVGIMLPSLLLVSYNIPSL